MVAAGNIDQKHIKEEEQEILNDLIKGLDAEILALHKGMTQDELERRKASQFNLADSYAQLMHVNYMKAFRKERQQNMLKVRDELYDTRIEVEIRDADGTKARQDIKIGLHELNVGPRTYVTSWKLPVCRHYLLDNTASGFHGRIKDNQGREFETDFELRLKRKVEIRFDKVNRVTHMYPLSVEISERIVSDEFLQELLRRRTEREFQNIVFSIQQKQGRIIQRPYQENMIVQGCAGSGKSMIMMHRLPILLYDNPSALTRNSIYIITPSESYMQMIGNMRDELEIDDLRMGTMNQYYDHLLRKYGIDNRSYGARLSKKPMTREEERYVYSDVCIRDIDAEICRLVQAREQDFAPVCERMGISFPAQMSTPQEQISTYVITTDRLIRQNQSVLKVYADRIEAVRRDIAGVLGMLRGRRDTIRNDISWEIRGLSDRIAQQEKILRGIRPQEEARIRNRKQIIGDLTEQYDRLKEELSAAARDEEYYAACENTADRIVQAVQVAGWPMSRIDGMARTRAALDQITSVRGLYEEICEILQGLDEKYLEYTQTVWERMDGFSDHMNALLDYRAGYLSDEEYRSVAACNDYYTRLSKGVYDQVYAGILVRMGRTVSVGEDGKVKTDRIACSPYLYTQIVYRSQGAPSAGRESLIAIDEAQNLTRSELELMSHINRNAVVFNLFGDVNQHIEGTKGVDRWSDLGDLVHFQQYDLMENYRNASQITEYCNKHLNMRMQAINIPGSGVHLMSDLSDMDLAIRRIRDSVFRKGSTAIIVRSARVADEIMEKYSSHAGYLNNMTRGRAVLQQSKWNILTVSQSKGLEFGTVIVLAHDMSRNERYVACTRALDGLYIYYSNMESGDRAASSDAMSNVSNRSVNIRSAVESCGKVQQSAYTSKAADTSMKWPIGNAVKASNTAIGNAARPSGKAGDKAVSNHAADKVQNNGRTVAKKTTMSLWRESIWKKRNENSPLRRYFEYRGLEVHDHRNDGGRLYVIGTRRQLAPYVREVWRLFGISGRYIDHVAEYGNRSAWVTGMDG